MRWLFVALILGTGCGARGPQGPAWPKAAERETDGGESLAPRQSKVVALDADPDDEEDDDKPAVATPAVTPAATPAGTAPAVTTPAVTTPDEPIMTEDIVIEIDD
jgi:hypothetical protein